MIRRVFKFSFLALICGASLSACGGGGGASATVQTDPTSAQAPSQGTGGTASSNPASGLVDYGRALRPYTALAKPAKGVSVADPDFPGNTRIVRVTDVAADFKAGVAVPVYPTIQSWNCDESLLFLYITSPQSGGQSGHALFDGKTYKFIKFIDINPADVEQVYWDPVNPALLRYVDNRDSGGTYLRELVSYNVNTGQKTVLKSFTGNAALTPTSGKIGGGGDPFAASADGDLFGFGVYQEKNGPGGAALQGQFSYRLSTNKISTYGTHEGNVAQALPSGRGLMLGDDTKVSVLSEAGAVQRQIAFGGTEHGDLLQNAAGNDVFVAVQFDGPAGSGNLMAANLTTGVVSTIIGESTGDGYPRTGGLLSGRSRAPGWVALAITGCPAGSTGNCNGYQPTVSGAAQTYLDQEIVLANIDTGKVYRVAHHRSTGNYSNAKTSNYWAQPNLVISPSGTRILVASDWGDANPNSPVINPSAAVDTYVIELPAYRGQ